MIKRHGIKIFTFLWLFCVFSTVSADPLILIDATPYTRIQEFKLDPATANQRLLPAAVQQQMATRYLRGFFAVWDTHYLDTQQNRIRQNFKDSQSNFLGHTLFDINFKAYASTMIPHLLKQWQYAVPATQHAAIVVRETNVRALPSLMPMFSDYRKAGGGYPFDMNQSEKLWVGRAVAVVSYTRDAHWAFVLFDGGLGWVDARDIATVTPHFIHRYRRPPFAAVIKEGVALTDGRYFLLDSRIGQIFPLRHGRLWVPVSGFAESAKVVNVLVPSTVFSLFPLSMTPRHVMQLIQQMLGEPYDWGGYYNFRDCSLTMVSLFAPFGRMLLRGSDQQKAQGLFINLHNKSVTDKQSALRQAKPFLTLVGLDGHVMLYLGEYAGSSYVFQDAWGLHSHQGRHLGRAVIGEEVITPLTLGQNIPGVYKAEWSDIQSITILHLH